MAFNFLKYKLKLKKTKPLVNLQNCQNRNSNFVDCFKFNQFENNFQNFELFETIRNSIPVVDAAFDKIKRLIGSFKFKCLNKTNEKFLNNFCENLNVGSNLKGIHNFVCSYLDNLLMFGNSIGEIVFDEQFNVVALYNANLKNLVIKQQPNSLHVDVCVKKENGSVSKPIDPIKILFTALNPKPGEIKGRSILQGLPFVSQILLKIYNAIGENFDRVGNVRFAITYKPGDNDVDRAYANERAELIAKEWAKGMKASRYGQIYDFVTVGDVQIKAIGAENQIIDCQIPARQMVEQIVAKLSIPPFMLGFSWSTTERMSEQQAKFLSNELEYYRRLINPTILKIASTVLNTHGLTDSPKVQWNILNFNDQINAAKTRLFNAQAQKIELENKKLEQTLNL